MTGPSGVGHVVLCIEDHQHHDSDPRGSSAAFRVRISPLPPEFNVGTLDPQKENTTQPEYPNFEFRG